jgi:hypothetical protein
MHLTWHQGRGYPARIRCPKMTPHRICAIHAQAAVLPSRVPPPPLPPQIDLLLAATSCACRARLPRCWAEAKAPTFGRTRCWERGGHR